MTLPNDIAHCVGRRTLEPDTPCCPRRDTCHRYVALIERPDVEHLLSVDLHLCSDDTFAAHRPLPAAMKSA